MFSRERRLEGVAIASGEVKLLRIVEDCAELGLAAAG